MAAIRKRRNGLRYALVLALVSSFAVIGGMDALSQTIDTVIPVHVSVPSEFKRVQMDCCLIPKVRILTYWSDGEDDFSPNINLLEEKTSTTSLLEYLPTIVSLPGQTLKLLGFVDRCGHDVAILSVAGISETSE